MKFIDPHIHMYSRTTDDYENMRLAGIKTVIEPSFWLGQERTSYKTLEDYWEHIITFERNRAKEFGINHFCAIAVNPREANNEKMSKEAMENIQRYLERDNVVALGEIGFDDITSQEEDILKQQLILGNELGCPIIVHTPHINKLEGTKRTFEIIEETGVDQTRIIVDHNTEETIELSKSYEVFSGITVYPDTKLNPIRAVNIIKKYGIENVLIKINKCIDRHISYNQVYYNGKNFKIFFSI